MPKLNRHSSSVTKHVIKPITPCYQLANQTANIELKAEILDKNKDRILSFLDSKKYSFDDFQVLISRLGGNIVINTGSHFKIIFVNEEHNLVTIGGGHRPHGKAHGTDIRGRNLESLKDAVRSILPSDLTGDLTGDFTSDIEQVYSREVKSRR